MKLVKRCRALNARKRVALASNKYSYTYDNPPSTTRRTTEVEGRTGAEAEGAIEGAGDDDSR